MKYLHLTVLESAYRCSNTAYPMTILSGDMYRTIREKLLPLSATSFIRGNYSFYPSGSLALTWSRWDHWHRRSVPHKALEGN